MNAPADAFTLSEVRLYAEQRGGFSGGDTGGSQRWTWVSLARKQKNFILVITKSSSRVYLSSALVKVIVSLPDLHFRLLMNDWMLSFCFFIPCWAANEFPWGEQQQWDMQSVADLQPQAWPLQGNSPDFPCETKVTPLLHNVRLRKMRIWILTKILLILLMDVCGISYRSVRTIPEPRGLR